MKTRGLTQLSLAAAAASLFLAAPASMASADEGKTGHCMGVNACKGHGSCKTANNDCKGMNSCKGKGFVVVDEATCEQLGGTFEAAEK
jgi:uncharacterized membrane protein